jgi:hypothetical protein
MPIGIEATVVPIYKPTGMDARSDSDNPWELLVNIAPTPTGWEQRPGSAVIHKPGATTTVRFRCANVFRFKDFLLCAAIGITDEDYQYLLIVDTQGRVLHASISADAPGISTQDIEGESPWGCASFGKRMFFSNSSGGGVGVIAGDKTGIYNPTALAMAQLENFYYGTVQWRAGTDSDNWPYVSGQFSGRILCSHLNRIFYAGFDEGQKVIYDQEVPANQTAVDGANVDADNRTICYLGKQSIVWTDPLDPFAIRFPNMRQLGTHYEITALASWNGQLFVFTENDVWAMSGQYDEEFSFRQVVSGVGCASKGSFAVAPEGVLFAHSSGIYITDGSRTEKLSEPIEFLFDPSYMLPVSLGDMDDVGAPMHLERTFGQAAYVASRREVWFPVKRRSTGEFHFALVLSLATGGWWLATGERDYAGKTNHATTRATGTLTGASSSSRTIADAGAGFVAAGVAKNDVFTDIATGLSARVESVAATTLVLKTWPYGTAAPHAYSVKTPALSCFCSGYRIVLPVGDTVLCFGWDENAYSDVLMEWTQGGGVLRKIPDPGSPTLPISARTRTPILMVSKPLLVQRARDVSVVGIEMNWRRAPNGAYHDRGGTWGVASEHKIYLWSAETNWFGETDVVEARKAPYPDKVYAALQTDPPVHYVWNATVWSATGGVHGTLRYGRRDGYVTRIDVNHKSRFVRFAVYGFGLTRALLRGIHLLYRDEGASGGPT